MAKIAVIEDNHRESDAAVMMLQRLGWTIQAILVAHTLEEAENILPQLEAGDIVLMDGSLSMQNNNADGNALTAMIRESHGENVTIVGFNSFGEIQGATHQLGKVKFVDGLHLLKPR